MSQNQHDAGCVEAIVFGQLIEVALACKGLVQAIRRSLPVEGEPWIFAGEGDEPQRMTPQRMDVLTSVSAIEVILKQRGLPCNPFASLPAGIASLTDTLIEGYARVLKFYRLEDVLQEESSCAEIGRNAKPIPSSMLDAIDRTADKLLTEIASRQPSNNALIQAMENYVQPVKQEQVNEAAGADRPADENSPADQPARHSLDYRSVHWFGTDFTFTPTQAACIKVLWEAWENKTPEVGQQAILVSAEVDSESERLADLFKNHSAWKTMIIPGSTRGAFSLSDPKQIISA